MGYRISYRGLDVVCDTIADLIALADYNQGNTSVVVRQSRQTKANKAQPTGDAGRDFISYLRDAHIKTLQILMTSDMPVTDAALRKALGVTKNNTLGGYFGAITRAAIKANFEGVVVNKTTVNAKQGEKEYTYEIPQEMKDRLRQYLPQ